jgi:tetratricopeptide (TPR) repeat protein
METVGALDLLSEPLPRRTFSEPTKIADEWESRPPYLVFIEAGRYGDADTLLTALIEQRPEESSLRLHRADVRLRLGQGEGAAADLERAQALGTPARAELLRLRTALHWSRGEYDAALQACEQWVHHAQHADARAAASARLALLLCCRGDLRAGGALIERLRADGRRSADLEAASGWCLLHEASFEPASEAFRTALALCPASDLAWFGLAVVRLHAERSADALAALRRAAAASPSDVGYSIARGWIQLTRRWLPDARQSFEAALQQHPQCAEAHGGLAVTFAMQNRTDASDHEKRVARRLQPDCFGSAFAEALHAARHGLSDSATGQLDRLLSGRASFPIQCLSRDIRVFALGSRVAGAACA